MRLVVTHVFIVEVDDDTDLRMQTLIADFQDSMTDNYLDSQDTEHETSDAKFYYYPKDLVTLTIQQEEAWKTRQKRLL